MNKELRLEYVLIAQQKNEIEKRNRNAKEYSKSKNVVETIKSVVCTIFMLSSILGLYIIGCCL